MIVKNKKMAFVVATPLTAKAFLFDFLEKLSADNEVYLIANFDQKLSEWDFGSVTKINVNIQRKISIKDDLQALQSLFSIFRTHKFDVVHSVTPKAGLLAMTASKLAGIEYRYHTFTGQVWANNAGLSRVALLNALTALGFSPELSNKYPFS